MLRERTLESTIAYGRSATNDTGSAPSQPSLLSTIHICSPTTLHDPGRCSSSLSPPPPPSLSPRATPPRMSTAQRVYFVSLERPVKVRFPSLAHPLSCTDDGDAAANQTLSPVRTRRREATETETDPTPPTG
jgi:hypothetical protein